MGRRRDDRGVRERPLEAGFTVIELLTIVVILGVLSLIALPTFLGQRDRAEATAAQADARNLVSAQYARLAGAGVFGSTITDLTTEGFRASGDVDHAVCVVGGSRFIVGAQYQGTTDAVVYDSAAANFATVPAADVSAALSAADPGCTPSTV